MNWKDERFSHGISKPTPCYDRETGEQCLERCVGCHATCERYKNFRRQIDEMNEAKKKYIDSHIPTKQYAKQTTKRKKY